MPRIGHDRTISPRSMAANTSARERPAVRSATEVTEPGWSCPWTAVSRRTASAGVAARGPATRCATSRSSPISDPFVTGDTVAPGSDDLQRVALWSLPPGG